MVRKLITIHLLIYPNYNKACNFYNFKTKAREELLFDYRYSYNLKLKLKVIIIINLFNFFLLQYVDLEFYIDNI